MPTPLSHVPLPLRIRILHQDDEIIVVVKPPHLRTVPGNAETIDVQQQPKQQPKLTASQAWKQVVCQYPTTITTPKDDIDTFLCQIAQVESYAKCLPHKWKSFQSFVKRNWKKYGATTFSADAAVQELLPRIFQRLVTAQQRLLPATTTFEESVVGQLALLLGYTTTTNLYIVHRLDCETSGVLVVARTSTAAAALCQAWRERESVSKLYLARVHCPPLDKEEEDKWNTIQDPLKPSTTERLKWEIVASSDEDAKACMTLWRRRKEDCLELKPVTGRTHQLRIHCRAHFGGIVGDTLYGSTAADSKKEERLYLHAYRLSFPHPRTNEQVTFVQDPEW